MVAKKKTASKKTARKKTAAKTHPLMVNQQSFDKEKCLSIIFDKLTTTSKSLGTIINQGKEEHGRFPDYSQIMRWIDADENLCEKYTRAREAQADFMADEIVEISDSEAEVVVDQNGVARKDSADIQHKRLRVDARKWTASKLKPKKYGDKVTTEHTGKDGGSIQVTAIQITGDMDAKEASILYKDLLNGS